MRKKIYTGYYNDSGYPFLPLVSGGVELATAPDDLTELSSILVLWGGADISPELYDHDMCKETYCSQVRDLIEWDLAKGAIERGIPIIGVCRGAQILCALAGGYLFQHTTGHAGSPHKIETYNGEIHVVNSMHHQMMCVPKKVDHEVLAWTSNRRSTVYKYDGDQHHPEPEKELECVWFPKIKGFAVQWHPEGMVPDCSATKFIYKEFMKHEN